MNIDTAFVGIGALRAEILILKAQICTHLQTRALAFWPKQILEAHRNEKLKLKKNQEIAYWVTVVDSWKTEYNKI